MVGSSGSESGTSVSLSSNGNTLAIGAPNYSTTGAVYIYYYYNNIWNTTTVSPTILPTFSGTFGTSVSLAGNGTQIVVGNPTYTNPLGEETGIVSIFDYPNNQVNIWPSFGDIYTPGLLGLGYNVNLSKNSNILTISSVADESMNYSNYNFQIYSITPTENQIRYGILKSCVADSSGNYVAVASSDNKTVTIYQFIYGNWAILGSPIVFGGTSITFANTLAMATIGSYLNIFIADYNNKLVYRYQYTTSWTQLTSIGSGTINGFGYDLSCSYNGIYVAIGTLNNQAYIYNTSTSNLTMVTGNVSPVAFGRSVAIINDGTIAVGDPNYSSGTGGTNTGIVYIINSTLGVKGSYNNNFAAGDLVGTSVGLGSSSAGTYLLVAGAPKSGTNGYLYAVYYPPSGDENETFIYSPSGATNYGQYLTVPQNQTTLVGANYTGTTTTGVNGALITYQNLTVSESLNWEIYGNPLIPPDPQYGVSGKPYWSLSNIVCLLNSQNLSTGIVGVFSPSSNYVLSYQDTYSQTTTGSLYGTSVGLIDTSSGIELIVGDPGTDIADIFSYNYISLSTPTLLSFSDPGFGYAVGISSDGLITFVASSTTTTTAVYAYKYTTSWNSISSGLPTLAYPVYSITVNNNTLSTDNPYICIFGSVPASTSGNNCTVYFYTLQSSGTSWSQLETIGMTAATQYGYSISSSTNTFIVAVGAPGSGAVYIYEIDSTPTIISLQTITSGLTNFGYRVAVSYDSSYIGIAAGAFTNIVPVPGATMLSDVLTDSKGRVPPTKPIMSASSVVNAGGNNGTVASPYVASSNTSGNTNTSSGTSGQQSPSATPAVNTGNTNTSQTSTGPNSVTIYNYQGSYTSLLQINSTSTNDNFGISLAIVPLTTGPMVIIGSSILDIVSIYTYNISSIPTPTLTLINFQILDFNTLGAGFGYSLSTNRNGNCLVVGAPYNASIWVFQNAIDWTVQGNYITSNNGGTLGYAVSIDQTGHSLAYGTSTGNYVYLYDYVFNSDLENNGYIQYLSTLTGTNGFGKSVCISPNNAYLIVGSSGSAYVYSGTTLLFTLTSPSSSAGFGTSVSIDSVTTILTSGSTGSLPLIVVGDPISNAIFVYLNSNLIQTITPGVTLFGQSVGIVGAGIVCGGSSSGNGSVYLYTINNTGYQSSFSVNTSNPTIFTGSGGNFGSCLAISYNGSTLIVGAPTYSASNNEGAAYIYSIANKVLSATLIGLDPLGLFGSSVQVNAYGTVVIIGNSASQTVVDNSHDVKQTGSAWIYKLPFTIGSRINGNDPSSLFGNSVACSGDGIVLTIGSPGYQSNTGAGFYNFYYLYYRYLSLGFSIATNRSDCLIVALGYPLVSNTGAVNIYRNNNGSITEFQTITHNIYGSGEGYAIDISASGSVLIVSAPYTGNGLVYVYNLNSTSGQYTFQSTLSYPSGGTNQGTSVAISASGAVIVFSVINYGTTGGVVVYSNGTYTLVYNNTANLSSNQGSSLSLSADATTLVVGANYYSVSGTLIGPTINIYSNLAGSWQQVYNYSFNGSNPNILNLCLATSSSGDVVAFGYDSYIIFFTVSNGSFSIFQTLSNFPGAIESIVLTGDGKTIYFGLSNNGTGSTITYNNKNGKWVFYSETTNPNYSAQFGEYICSSYDGSKVYNIDPFIGLLYSF